MSITVELPLEVEVCFAAKARAKGISLGEFVRDYLIENASLMSGEKPSTAELDAAFEEMADILSGDWLPLSDEAISRECIYAREDEMH